MVSGCIVGGNQSLSEVSNATIPLHKRSVTVEPQQFGPPLGWEVSFPESVMQSQENLSWWITSMKDKEINTLLLHRSLFEDRGESAIQWKALVKEAHQQRIRVYAVVNLREELRGEGSLQEWSDIRFNADSGVLQPSGSPDLLHPKFQESIKIVSLDLATAGADMIVFRFDPPSGPFDGFSQYGLEGFQRDFDYRLFPRKLFTSDNRQRTQDFPKVVPVTQVRGKFSPEFWRWTGWKNREYLNALDSVMAAVRQQHPGTKFGIELHTDTMINPRQALVEYTEDFLESRQRLFDRFIVVVSESGVPSEVKPRFGKAVIKMTELLGDPAMVFVLVSSHMPIWVTASEVLNIKAALGLQRGVGLGFRGHDVP